MRCRGLLEGDVALWRLCFLGGLLVGGLGMTALVPDMLEKLPASFTVRLRFHVYKFKNMHRMPPCYHSRVWRAAVYQRDGSVHVVCKATSLLDVSNIDLSSPSGVTLVVWKRLL